MWPLIPSGNVAPSIIRCFALRFVIKTEILLTIIDFYCKRSANAEDKSLEQCFLKEFKATCKNSCESKLKQQKAI